MNSTTTIDFTEKHILIKETVISLSFLIKNISSKQLNPIHELISRNFSKLYFSF